MRANINLIHCDCMEAMKGMEDNQFDLAICDPPYGIKVGIDGKVGIDKAAPCKQYKPVKWDSAIPGIDYFGELKRISNNQIIWGVNHYTKQHNFASGRVVWDKENSGNFSDCELAYQSYNKSVNLVKVRWNGMLQYNIKRKEKRIHPTQKPIPLYKWLLEKYAKPGDKILDTHLGSGSIAIACWDLKFDLEAHEIDADYYKAAKKRFDTHIKQGLLF